MDDVMLVAHPGIVGPTGEIKFRSREDIGLERSAN